MSAEQARAELMAQVVDDAKKSAAVEVKKIEDQAKSEAEERSKRILGTAEDYRRLYGEGDGTPRPRPAAKPSKVSKPAAAKKKAPVKKTGPVKKKAPVTRRR